MDKHEVWVELVSGTRVIVGRDLPDVSAANLVASRWIGRARNEPEAFHETAPGSGCVIRGSAIIVVKANVQPVTSKLRGPREGVWL